MTRSGAGMLVGTLMLALSGPVLAQRGVPGGSQSVRPRQDTTVRDTTAKDSTKKELIKWNDIDSVMKSLMDRPGYTSTRYQGDRVIFNAQTKTLNLLGNKAGVNRDQTILVGDTISYSDSTKIVVARGDTVILRDPSQQAADVIAQGRMAYNIEAHRGSVTNISTSIAQTGQNWFVHGANANFVNDTIRAHEITYYVRDGIITSCDDSVPDYHFRANEIKMVTKNIMVARPAILYIGEVPVMWLPFIFQDIRSGRRSGILTPRFGLNELFRNSPTYRRHVDNLGYYFAINDYMDAEFALDWRSGARPTDGDPGYVRTNGELNYRWLDRFVSGRVAVSHQAQRDGSSNTALSWSHNENFSNETSLNANINYVTNTFIQRTTNFNPASVLASIQSQANYQTKLGPASLSLGGNRTQYPGRAEVEQTFPNFSISSPTLAPTSWLDWTPSFTFVTNQQLKIDQVGEFTYRFFNNARGLPDSSKLDRNERQTTSSFGTPIKIAGFSWTNTFALNDHEIDAPQTIVIYDPNDSSKRTPRVFAKSYVTSLDWQTGFALPSLLHGSLNLAPSVTLQNVDGSYGFWVRSHLSGGQWVHQSKRVAASLSASPTLFALFPGFGPVSRFRHSITPVISFQYAPAGHLPTEFLQATDRSRQGFLGSLPSNQISLGLSHVLEAKMKNADTSATAEERKIKILSMNFSSLAYDIERARKTHRSGFTTSNLSSDFTSDLLPGFSAGVEYSLYQGDVLSDTAVFKPFREGLHASFTLNGQSGLFGAISRVFGRAVPEKNPAIESAEKKPDDALASQVAATPVAGITARNNQFSLPETQGWQATLEYTSSRQRPPTGNGLVLFEDPTLQCAQFQANPIVYQQCIEQAQARTTAAGANNGGILGAPFIRTQPRDNLESGVTFHLTPKWAGQWHTNYDFQAKKFGMQQVTLQRELHDWRAIFSFTQAPNGNFAFTFFIALNAEPDLKFNYDKQTYRPITP